VSGGEVSELADERDLGSRAAMRASSNLAFPTPMIPNADGQSYNRRPSRCGSSSVGRALPCQGSCRGFKSHLPLSHAGCHFTDILRFFLLGYGTLSSTASPSASLCIGPTL
jgi:hypothetical protein